MQIQPSNAENTGTPSLTGGENQKTHDAFAALLEDSDQAEMLHKMVKDGIKSLWEWQLEELKKKVAAKVMAAMGVTEASLKAMPDDQRAEIEKKILEEVERIVKQMVENKVKEKNPLAGISPQVDSATMQALLGVGTE